MHTYFVNIGTSVVDVIANNLIKVIMRSLLQYGSLFNIDLASKLINFGVDGVLVFQGAKIGVITQNE